MAASNSQLEAQVQELSRRVTGLASAMADLSPAQVAFLSVLGKLPNQTTSNTMISTAAGSLSAADRGSINGLVQAVNNLQAALQANGFES